MRNPVRPSSCVTPAGTSNELDVQNEWEENTHTQTLVLCCGCTLAQCVPCLYLLPVNYSCRAYTIAQSARIMYVLPVSYSCRAVAVPSHRVLYSRRATVSTSNVRFTRFVLVPCCGCTIPPRFVLAPCNSSTGNVRFIRLYSCRAVVVPLHCVCTRAVQHSARVINVLPVLYSYRAVAVPLHRVLYSRRATVARVMYVFPVLYSCREVAIYIYF